MRPQPLAEDGFTYRCRFAALLAAQSQRWSDSGRLVCGICLRWRNRRHCLSLATRSAPDQDQWLECIFGGCGFCHLPNVGVWWNHAVDHNRPVCGKGGRGIGVVAGAELAAERNREGDGITKPPNRLCGLTRRTPVDITPQGWATCSPIITVLLPIPDGININRSKDAERRVGLKGGLKSQPLLCGRWTALAKGRSPSAAR